MRLFNKSKSKKVVKEEKNLIIELENITADFDNPMNLALNEMARTLSDIGYGKKEINDFMFKSHKSIEEGKEKGKTEQIINKYIEMDFNKRKKKYIKDLKARDLVIDKISETALSDSEKPLMKILNDKNYLYLKTMVEVALVELDFDENHGYSINYNKRINLLGQGLEAVGYGQKFIKDFKHKLSDIVSEEKKKNSSKDEIINLISKEYNKVKNRNYSLATTYLNYLNKEIKNFRSCEREEMKKVIKEEMKHMLSLSDEDLQKYYEKKDLLANVERGTHKSYFHDEEKKET